MNARHRNGQPDFMSDSASGDYLVLSINDGPSQPSLTDELKVTGYDYATLRITSPNGFVISRNLQTVAGSAFYRLDVDGNGIIDDRAYDYNLQYGEYILDIFPETGSGPDPMVSAGIGIDGSQRMRIFKDYDLVVGRQHMVSFSIPSRSGSNSVYMGWYQPTDPEYGGQFILSFDLSGMAPWDERLWIRWPRDSKPECCKEPSDPLIVAGCSMS